MLGTLGSVAFDTMAVLLTSGVVFPFFPLSFFIIIKVMTGVPGRHPISCSFFLFLSFVRFSSGPLACIIIYYLFIVWVSDIGRRGFIRDLS